MKSIVSSLISTTHIVELFGMLLEGSAAMFGLKDSDHRYIFANRELESSFGVKTGSLIGKTIDDFISKEDAAEIREKEKYVMASGMPARFSERFQVGDKMIECIMIRFPVRDDGGRVVGVGFAGYSGGRNLSGAGLHEALDCAHKTISELERLVEKMKLQARTDSLTGVWNRRQIEESIHLEMARMQRYGHQFSLVFIDLDRFKLVNDTLGHKVGDLVLIETCKVVAACMRATDVLGRWGGEEFLLLLPNTGRLHSHMAAERMRVTIEQHSFPEIGHITASFGVATVKASDSISDLIERADTALYAAKNNGRNRVEADLPDKTEPESERNGMGLVRLVWRSGYECGNALIDRQHRKLFEDANSILDAVIGSYPKGETMQMIDMLLSDVVQHFDDEEAIFKASGFPESDEHCRAHAELTTKALDLSVRYAADNVTVGEIFGFLATDVIAKHLLSEDRKFFSYLTAAEETAPT